MVDAPEDDLATSARKPARRWHPALVGFVRLLDSIDAFVRLVFDDGVIKAAIAAMTVIYGMTIWALPPEQRYLVVVQLKEVMGGVSTIVTGTPFAWLGWGFAAIALLAGAPFVVYQHRQIRNQGTRLAECRGRHDTQRVSSRSPEQLSLYEDQARANFGKGPGDGS